MLGRRASARRAAVRWGRASQPGQALVEVALIVPLLLVLAFGVLGIGRVTQARLGVSAVTREAARAGALADEPGGAGRRGLARGQEVATGYGLTNGTLRLTVDPGALVEGGQVRAAASYEVAFDDLPLMGRARVRVAAEHRERIDLYRSRWS